MLKLLLFGLFYLTQGCPLLGGDAIYEARAALGLTYREIDDEAICANFVSDRSLRQVVETLRVQPNPAKTSVQLLERLGEPYSLYNQIGVLVQQGQVSALGIRVADLPTGLYQLVCGGNAYPVQQTKLVFIHD